VISVEMNPPHGFSTHKLIAGARMLVEAGADTINLPDSPMARMRMSPWAACQLIQSKVGVETILHFPTRGRNLLRVQSDLLAAHALDVRNIFVVMGDPTSIGDYPEATDSYDVVPSGLIHLIHQGFNAGVDHAGTEMGDATCFFIGCALNLRAKDLAREARVLNRKIEAGAHFTLTQPLYDPNLLHRFKNVYTEAYGELNIPVLVGILPIYGARHASFLHHEVPGIHIPEDIHKRIAAAGDNAPGEGVRIATELLKEIKPHVQGTYIMSAFGRYDLVAEIIESIRDQPPLSDPC
jgi:homocysteine S-methyltransferase